MANASFQFQNQSDQIPRSFQKLNAHVYLRGGEVLFTTAARVGSDQRQLHMSYKQYVQISQASKIVSVVPAGVVCTDVCVPLKLSKFAGQPKLSYPADPSLTKNQVNKCCCQGCHRPLVEGSLYCSHHGPSLPSCPTIQKPIGTALEPYARFYSGCPNTTNLLSKDTESTTTLETKPGLNGKVEKNTIAQTAITLVRIGERVSSPPEKLDLNLKQARSGKQCLVDNCTKLAVRSTKRCIGHGGGSRCRVEGCPKSAQGSTSYCIAHGGGKRCAHLNCDKSALGSTKHCIAHGGGNRCSFAGCSKSAPGNTLHCIAHGGGKRCQVPGCSKSSQRSSFFCRAHGGGKSCLTDGCNKSAFGASVFCKIHGK